jgi:hypothetical protein
MMMERKRGRRIRAEKARRRGRVAGEHEHMSEDQNPKLVVEPKLMK